MYILKIGDKLADDSVIICDEDRLCYQVLSTAKGVTGLRTINKALLEEWVGAVRQYPDYSSSELRELLSGKTEIDKFEYGYAATLKKMAEMVLGIVEVIHPKADYSAEFCKWFAENRGKGKDTTAKKYISYFKTLTDTYQEPTNSYWHGLYRVMYNYDAEKDVIEIGSSTEFKRIYGDIISALETKVKGEGMTDEGFRRAVDWFWLPEVKPHTCVTSALKAYSDFLKWRETQNKGQEEPSLTSANKLDIALKYFAEHRFDTVGNSGKNYDDFCIEMRHFYETVDADVLASCDYAVFRNGLSQRQVANSYFANHTETDKRKLGDFLADVRKEPKDISVYLDNPLDVPGIGGNGMMLTNFLMRVRPDVYVTYSQQMFDAVKVLGLTQDASLPRLTASSYDTYKGIQTAIRDRMIALGIPSDLENSIFPDYITVNEFTWFVSANLDSIKETIMNKKMKTDAPTNYEGPRKSLNFNPESKDDELLFRLLSALRAKPFVILAGHSGTGKSRYVKKLAYMTCNATELRQEGQLPGNYLLLQVKPNWHDSTDLLGFRNAMDGNRYQKTALIEFLFRAYHFKETPFFLCLDEMNLAPVEQYFAEFLSAMESTEPVRLNDITEVEDNLLELGCEWTDSLEYLKANKFSIPENLFIVGTVNMDETTNQFSRKVLDRAFTIEMTDVNFANFGKVAEPSYNDTIEDKKIDALLDRERIVDKLDDEDIREDSSLVKVQKALESTAFAIAYRFANEYTLLKRAFKVFDPGGTMKLDALDQAVLMKILPRIAGEKDYIKDIYGKGKKQGLLQALEGQGDSCIEIEAIWNRAEGMNASYITFWP